MIFNPVMNGGGSAGFSGTANIIWQGRYVSFHIAYLNENMQLVQLKGMAASPPSSIPVPQMVYLSAPGRLDRTGCSGDFEDIEGFAYPPGSLIYVTGDITITSS